MAVRQLCLLFIQAGLSETLTVPRRPPAVRGAGEAAGGGRLRVRVWDEELEADDVGPDAAAWLSRVLGRHARRVVCGMRRAACGLQHAACGVRRAACGVWRVA